ncbi:CbtA family protein [Gordonia sinesedis]
MEKKFIGAGLLSGLVAGIVSFLFARAFIEPQIAKALDYENGRSSAAAALAGGGDEPGGELFSRSIQQNIGAGVGSVVFALCMGAFFAVAFTLLWMYVGRKYPTTDARWVAAGLGVLSFVAVAGVPFFAYPANPPAVGSDDTIGARSAAYLTVTLLSVLFMIGAVILAFWLRPRLGGLLSGVAGAVAYLVAVTVAVALLPEYDDVPGAMIDSTGRIVFPGFPGGVLGDFRVYAIANQVILWTLLTLVFVALIGWMMRTADQPDGAVGTATEDRPAGEKRTEAAAATPVPAAPVGRHAEPSDPSDANPAGGAAPGWSVGRPPAR